MSQIFKIVLFGLIFTFTSFVSWSKHLKGGDFYYDYLGNNQYKFYLVIFRDQTQTGFDGSVTFTIYDGKKNLFDQVTLSNPVIDKVPVVFNNPCVVPPNDILTERAVYTGTIMLPPSPDGYDIAYQRCCRGDIVTNLKNAGDLGFTLYAHVTCDNNKALVNSSPRFKNYPPQLICNNENLFFDHSATDIDGDELRYFFITPFAGGTPTDPAPTKADTIPYPVCTWANGFSNKLQLGTGSKMTIDSITGALFVDAELTGKFSVGIIVKEYRNGVYLGETYRDVLFNVINCVVTLSAEVTPQLDLPNAIDFCQGTTINFKNESFGGTTYLWDFGVPNTTTDVSSEFEPSYTFPSVGKYMVTLIVNPGKPCSDTVVEPFEVYENFLVDFTAPSVQCLSNNSFDFQAVVNSPSQPTIDWDFGSNATPSKANGVNVSGIKYSAPGSYPVKMNAVFGNCKRDFSGVINVQEDVLVQFDLAPLASCNSLTQNFINTSEKAVSFSWDFGDNSSSSTSKSPTHTYTIPGSYTVKLVADNLGCKDSLQKNIVVDESLSIKIISDTFGCITNNSFDFSGVYSGPQNPVFSWEFGASSNVKSSSNLSVSGISFNQVGMQKITLTASAKECKRSVDFFVTIFDVPTVDFTRDVASTCVPFNLQFRAQPNCLAPYSLNWDFGNGQFSKEENPKVSFASAGNFDVKLTLTPLVGCTNPVENLKIGFINAVNPPVADFNTSADFVFECNPGVQFADQSIGANQYLFKFNENGASSTEKNPYYEFTSPGTKHVKLIAANSAGCSDTVTKTILVEPLGVYVPNTFTPDDDNYNNTFNPVFSEEVVGYEFLIFDRWGTQLFDSKLQSKTWDGKYNGQDVPEGLYAYVLKYRSCKDVQQFIESTGFVNVMR